MKPKLGKLGKTTFIILILFMLSTGGPQNADVAGKSSTTWTDELVNSGSGEVQTSIANPLGWLIALMVKNPTIYPTRDASAVVRILLPRIQKLLTPIWETLILLNAIYFIWGARDPAARNAAKQRMINLILGMILCGLAAPIFQLILDVEKTLVMQILSRVSIGTEEMAGGYLVGGGVTTLVVLTLVHLTVTSFGTALCCILTIIAMPFIALGLRYVAVIIFAILFPIMIFLYFFDFTKTLGSKLFRTAMLWVAVPIVQAVLVAIMISGVKSMENLSMMGGFVALASFVLIGMVPFQMEGLMGAIGGALIHSGYTTSNPRLVFLGNLVQGSGASSFTQAAWQVSQGMQEAPGGDFMKMAAAAGHTGGITDPRLVTESRERKAELKGIDKNIDGKRADIKKKQAEMAAAAALGQTARVTSLQNEIKGLETQVTTEQAKKHYAGVQGSYIEPGRKEELKGKTYDQLKKELTSAQLYRLVKEQEAGLTTGFEDLLRHKGSIMRGYLFSPISPGELLAPVGAFLGGLMTHLVSTEMPLGKSLLGLTQKMMPKRTYVKDSQGRQVAVVKQEWSSWGDVAKSAGKPLLFVAGVSLAAILGAPLLLAMLGTGLAIKSGREAIERGTERESKIRNLQRDRPDEYNKMKELAKAKASGAPLTPEQKKKIGQIEWEFGGMKIE
ncbi:MAG: hypothetical protein V1703_01965, partial [Candidatus Altiarchaeota archaeon]